MFRVLAVLALAAATLSACVVVPVPVHRGGRYYSESPPPVYVAPYPHRHYHRGY